MFFWNQEGRFALKAEARAEKQGSANEMGSRVKGHKVKQGTARKNEFLTGLS